MAGSPASPYSPTLRRSGNGNGKKTSYVNPTSLILNLLIGMAAFHIGLTVGHRGCRVCVPSPKCDNGPSSSVERQVTSSQQDQIFPKSMQDVVVGMAAVNRDDFASTFDVGVPLDLSSPQNKDVLLLYTSSTTLPKDWSTSSSSIPAYTSADEATKNCDVVKVVLNQPDLNLRQCIAVQGQWESFHVHKFMRLEKPAEDTYDSAPKNRKALSLTNDFRYVSRGHLMDGRFSGIPRPSKRSEYNKMLTEYLTTVDATMERLKPIAAKSAGDGPHKAVVVMVCNFGQSELLVNFICSSRARGLDLSRLLVFATDNETVKLAESLQINVFDVKDSFGELPVDAARNYGDKVFMGMMMAKVYCVDTVNALGYDVLFQDVDVVWRKNPLDYFYDPASAGDFDLYFQDDGQHSARYAPYSPNTGFYFVRYNPRTEYFFSVFTRMGDLIQQSGSHQSALTSVMAEHASWRGLRVKIFGRDAAEGRLFPGGFHYHRRKQFMKDMLQGAAGDEKTEPYMFHMSWTKNKDNKKRYFQQMGDWFVKDDQCGTVPMDQMGDVSNLPDRCCSSEAVLVCHYRDKPSKIPCRDSPPIDAGMKSFW